jgi:hypothetical protein
VGGWRRLHNKGLHDFYDLPKVFKYEMGGSYSAHGVDEKCAQSFVRKT